jgi:superfamily II RNA helicase
MEYRGLTLDPFQVEAILHAQNQRSVLVSAPTGTGKTIIADYIVEQALSEGREVIYTAPVKALSNQKFRDYCRVHGEDNVGLITGDLVINRAAPLRIMTTEILRNMLLTGEDLQHLSYVIIDEIHFLDDLERGTVWEEVLIYLPPSVNILGLSATLANIQEFADWLTHVRGMQVEVVISDDRHVPLDIYLANRDAGICDLTRFEHLHQRWVQVATQKSAELKRSRDKERRARGGRRRGGGRRSQRLTLPGQAETRHFEIIRMLGDSFRPLLYFVFSRKMSEQFARELNRRGPEDGFTTEDERKLIKERVDQFDEDFLKVMTSEQETMYLKGIAYHHAGLHVGLKGFVEELYERRLIKVLYCTSTFALGINMPARCVCFQALRKYDGRGVVPLTVRQFMQKAGRAGRRGLDDVGYVVILEEFADFERDRDAVHSYIAGRHEQVRSAFNLSFNSVVNLLERHDRNLDDIRDVINKSFLNFHFLQRAQRDAQRLEDIRSSLVRDNWDPEDEESPAPPRALVGRAKKYRNLKKLMGRGQDKVFQDFSRKIHILQGVGYVQEDLSFNAGARILQHLQIEEIFSTEIAISGVLDALEPELIFAGLCALSNTFSRTVEVKERPRGQAAKLAKALRAIRYSDVVRGCEHAIGVPVTFTPEMIPFGLAWYQGKSLSELMLMIDSANDVSGDLVSAFRRTKDLCTQLRRVYGEDPYMSEKLRDIARTVSRDEVEVVG